MRERGEVVFYTASKVRHYLKWQELRSGGVSINASWIDMVGEEEVRSEEEWGEVSRMCLREAREADVLLLYAEDGDVLRGAYMEVGAALSSNKRVGVIVPSGYRVTEILLPHPLVDKFSTVEEAVEHYRGCLLLEDFTPLGERVRELPAVFPRVEGGAIRFGKDWPGLFLRGDGASEAARQLDIALFWLKERVSGLNAEGIAYRVLKSLQETIDRDVLG